jgi:hypothetical protein
MDALDAFETFCHDAGAGLGKGATPMRGDTPRPPFVLAALVGGLALLIAGFIIAAEMRLADARDYDKRYHRLISN